MKHSVIGQCIRGTTLVIATIVASPANALTGNDWNKWNDNTKDFYINGVIDSWTDFEQLRLGRKPPGQADIYTGLTKCIYQGFTYAQSEAIVKKWMEATPSEWHYSMSTLVTLAMIDACHLIDKKN